ncbi:MAG: glycosyltransferase [Myxococcales bacterium FL481]|nr:MAG: glycosyltransferase [Myxococcales bacterium FL481]
MRARATALTRSSSVSRLPPLSVLLLLRDAEHHVVDMVRLAAELPPLGPDGGAQTEVLALDQRSTDNTLSVLSVLAKRYGALRIIHDVAPGHAWNRGVDRATGEVLLAFAGVVQASELAWCLAQVRREGISAATVSGEVIAVRRQLAQRSRLAPTEMLGIERAVARQLALDGQTQRLISCPPSHTPFRVRAVRRIRERLTRLGLGAFDRPRRRA